MGNKRIVLQQLKSTKRPKKQVKHSLHYYNTFIGVIKFFAYSHNQCLLDDAGIYYLYFDPLQLTQL